MEALGVYDLRSRVWLTSTGSHPKGPGVDPQLSFLTLPEVAGSSREISKLAQQESYAGQEAAVHWSAVWHLGKEGKICRAAKGEFVTAEAASGVFFWMMVIRSNDLLLNKQITKGRGNWRTPALRRWMATCVRDVSSRQLSTVIFHED